MSQSPEGTPEPVADATAELQRDQAAQEFVLGDDEPTARAPSAPLFGAPPQSPAAIDPYAPVQTPSRAERRGNQAKTLEDLYVLYPELGRGDWKLRVSRTAPRSFHGCSTAGFLGEFYERLSLDGFRDKFGGGRYTVTVMRPVGDGATATLSDYRTVGDVKFVIPGDPTLEGIPGHNPEDEMKQTQFAPHMVVGNPNPAIEIERLKIQDRERERDHQERLRMEGKLDDARVQAMNVPSAHVQTLHQFNDRAFDDIKQHNAAQQTFWQSEVERLRSEAQFATSELRTTREELARAQTDAANTNRQIETASMREQKERFEERMADIKQRADDDRRRMQEESSSKIETMSTDHRRQVEDLVNRHAEERRNYEATQGMERERVREDSRAQVQSAERSKEQEIASLTRTSEARIDDIRRSTESQLNAMRDQTRREVDTVRATEGAQVSLAKESAETRIAVMIDELQRARGELVTLRSENADLRDRQHKEPIAAMMEAKEMAKLTGMIEASDVPAPAGESTTQQLVAMGKQLVDSAPDLIDKIAEARRAGSAAQQRVVVHSQQQQQPPQLQQQQQQQQQRPPGRYQPPQSRTQVPVGPQGAGNYAPPPMGGVAHYSGSPVPLSPHVSQIASPVQPGGASAETGAVPFGNTADTGAQGGQAVTVGTTVVPQQGQQVQQAPVQQPQTQAQAPGAPQSGSGLPRVAVEEFFTELDKRIAQRTVPSSMFADELVSRLGPDMTRQLLQAYSPDVIVETARQATQGKSSIVTRDGRKYVAEVFARASQIVNAQAAA